MNLPAASYGVSKGKDFYIETPSVSQTLPFGKLQGIIKFKLVQGLSAA